jgi:hypothetical protein
MDKITHILENVVRCKYFEASVHIKNPIKNSYQDGLGKTTQILDHVVVVHILIWDKRKSQINEYSDEGKITIKISTHNNQLEYIWTLTGFAQNDVPRHRPPLQFKSETSQVVV